VYTGCVSVFAPDCKVEEIEGAAIPPTVLAAPCKPPAKAADPALTCDAKPFKLASLSELNNPAMSPTVSNIPAIMLPIILTAPASLSINPVTKP
jgi:hypothetical protein